MFTDLRTQEQFYKIGITSKSVKERYPKSLYKNYKYSIICTITSNSDFIFKTEQDIHKRFNQFKLNINKDFQGYSECYNLNLPINDIIQNIL